MTTDPASLDKLKDELIRGDRRSLSKAITLIESSRGADRLQAERLLEAVLPKTGHALRIAVTGIPGSGKSTLIAALGAAFVAKGRRLAVLAIDPSSERSGGSLLGDQTRMNQLAGHPDVYIRPSPARGKLGGVGEHTLEALLLCEAAGFDVIIVETVGVGQSEIDVAHIVDIVVWLTLAGTGDELQGIKRGITEIADVVVVGKADGAGRAAAEEYASACRHSYRLLRPNQLPEVLWVSALTFENIEALRELLEQRQNSQKASGELLRRREDHARFWFRRRLDSALKRWLTETEPISRLVSNAEQAVVAGSTSAPQAVARVMQALSSAFEADDSKS